MAVKNPVKSIWVIYVNGKPAIWCISKKSANGYRSWGRRKKPVGKINIVEYVIKDYKMAVKNFCVHKTKGFLFKG